MAATRLVLLRDYAIYLTKLWLDGLKDAAFMVLSTAAVIFDLYFKGRRERLFYRVMRLGERFDLWINLHGALAKMKDSDDGLFGGSKAGSKTLLGQLEQAVRGGDEPRKRVKRPPPRRP